MSIININAQSQIAVQDSINPTFIEIKYAIRLESIDSPGMDVKMLVGDVHMVQDDVVLFCDSAYFNFDANRVNAFGNVIIQQEPDVEVQCDQLYFNGNNKQTTLIGNAQLTDGSTTVKSERLDYNLDTKYGYYETGGEIIDKDTRLTSGKAYYYGQTKDVIYVDSVDMVNPEFSLKTDSLNHNLDTEIASFFGPSVVVTEGNTIISDGGYYDRNNQVAHFGSRTTIEGEDDFVEADSIYYNGKEGIQRAFGNATVDRDSTLHIEGDTIFYNNTTGEGEVYGDGYVNNDGQELWGDKLIFNEQTGSLEAYGDAKIIDGASEIKADSVFIERETGDLKAFGDAHLIDKGSEILADSILFNEEEGTGFAYNEVIWVDEENQLTILGDYVEYNEKTSFLLATSDPVMINVIDGDSLLIKADTLITAEEGPDSSRMFKAYQNVQIYKSDMQSVSDSLYYDGKDSVFHFHRDPLLWVEETQLKGDTITLYTTNNELDKIYLDTDASIYTATWPGVFDQIVGDYIAGKFENGNMHHMHVDNNAESIYFLKNDRGQYTGVNQSVSKDMVVDFSDAGQVSRINFIEQSKATYFPIQDVDPFETKLKKFQWFSDRRPKRNTFEKYLLELQNAPLKRNAI